MDPMEFRAHSLLFQGGVRLVEDYCTDDEAHLRLESATVILGYRKLNGLTVRRHFLPPSPLFLLARINHVD